MLPTSSSGQSNDQSKSDLIRRFVKICCHLANTWKEDDRWSIDAEWTGTAMIYAASGTGSFALSGDYQVGYEDESDPEDLRAARLFQASQGKEVGEVPYDKLGEELVVIFGAKITAVSAVETLKALVARIEEEGLIIGRVGMGDFIYEPVERELTVDDALSFDQGD
jgi:hypothetical protein